MKQITNTFLLLSALAGCSFSTAQAATLTSTGSVQLDSATNWSPSQTPSSGNDTLSIGHGLSIDSTWTIGSGQAMTWTAGNWRFTEGGHLTVASGGTLTADGIYESGATATRSLTIEAGATATTRRYFSGNGTVTGGDSGWTTKWIASTSGVTTFNITEDYRIRGGSIEVDLSSYDISNGTTLILADYGTLLDGPYYAVTLTSGWTGTVDYTYDQGGGDLAVALTNIVAPDSTPPVITLVGDNPINLVQGAPFTDPGATAADDVDGDISGDIVVSGDTVDTNTVGAYILSYDVSDAASNDATTVTRTVNVNDPPAVTWDDGAGDDNWSSATNWDGDIAAANGDSVVLTATAQSFLDYAWTIENGQSLTADSAVLTGNGFGDDFGIITGGSLTLASGGSMNIGFMRPRSDAPDGGDLIIEAGATLNTMVYGLSGKELNITYIADAAGVTTWTNSLAGAGKFSIGGDTLTVDLSNYTVVGASSLTLVDYVNTDDLVGTFASVMVTDSSGALTEGLDYTLDYIADSNITLNILVPASPITSTTTDGIFNVGATWVDGVVPVSITDSVVLASQVTLTSDFTIGSGQSMTAATTSGRLSLGAGHLTVATGGTLDLVTVAANMTEFGAGGHFTIEPAATAKVDRYWNDEASPSYINEWIADADGVTTFEVAVSFALRGTNSELRVDLSNYDTANGDTLVLASYGSLSLQNQAVGDNGWATITLTAGWSADLDLTTGNEIRLINIAYQPDVQTSNGTPHSWIDLYSLVTGGDYEAADLLDSDSDGRLNWEEYQDGTDPTGVGVTAPIAFTLVDATDGSADTLTFSAPDTTWVIEASTDSVEWGVVPQVSFIVNADGSITATVPQLATLNSGGTYRVVETSENTKLVIFLTEGQSNMVGWSSKTSYEMDDYPTPNMFQQSRGQARGEYDPGAADSVVRAFQPFQTTQHRSGSTTGNYVSLDFYFARAYAKDHPDEDVLIVKNASGGTGFVTNQWNAGESLDVLADPYLAAALAEVSGEYATIEFGGILWHQGEADAATAASAAAYASNLTALFARHRAVVSSRFSVTQAPVIIGTMVPANIANNSTGYYDDIDAIHRDISNLVANANFADLSGIVGEAGQHFLADGYQTAGEIYYDTWLAMQDMVTWVGDNNLTGNDALPGSNPDSDGLSNLLEFAFGTDPTVSNGGSIGYSSGVVTPGLPLPVLETITSNNVDFRAVFARRKEWAAAGLTYTVQFSPDLTEWVDSADTPILLEIGSGDIDAVYVEYPLIIHTEAGFEKAQFFRLSVSQD